MIDQRLSFRKLEIFCLFAELGSVGETADRLQLAQPAVSEHLRSIERMVGCRLTERQGRGLALTEAGSRLHAWAIGTLQRTHELERELDSLDTGAGGRAAVGASTTTGAYVLPAPIAEFARQRPLARVLLRPSSVSAAIAGAISGELDFSVVIARPQTFPREVEVTALATEPYVLVAAADNHEVPVALERAELSRVPFVCMAEEPTRAALIDEPLREAGVPFRHVVVELGHPEAIKRTVEQGLGVAFLVRVAVEQELIAGRLRVIATDVSLSAPIVEVHRAHRRFSPLQRDLLGAITAHLSHRGLGQRRESAELVRR